MKNENDTKEQLEALAYSGKLIEIGTNYRRDTRIRCAGVDTYFAGSYKEMMTVYAAACEIAKGDLEVLCSIFLSFRLPAPRCNEEPSQYFERRKQVINYL